MNDPRDSTDGSDGDEPRITVVPLTAEDVLRTNFVLYNSGFSYRLGSNVEPEKPEDLVLKNVYTPDEVRETSRDLIEEFPYEESLVEQSALWVRAFAGFHFFYDANHRTGISTLRAMMEESEGVEPFEPFVDFKNRTVAALDASKEERRWITRDEMYKKDALYGVWRKYFEEVLGQ